MFRFVTALILVLASLAGAQTPSTILWGVDGSGGGAGGGGGTSGNTASSLYRIDPATGTATVVGSLDGIGITGLAVHPTTGVLYGVTNTDPRGVVTVDRTTGAGSTVTAFDPVEAVINDITFGAAGQLYGWWGNFAGPKSLATIDTATADVVALGMDAIPSGSGNGLAFCGTTLYLVPAGPTGTLYTIDPVTSTATPGVTLAGQHFTVDEADAFNALACSLDGTLYASQRVYQLTEAHLVAIPNPASSGAVVHRGATVDRLDALAFDEVVIDEATATTTTPDVNESVDFSAVVRATSTATVSWDFDDGATDTGAAVAHAFAAAGTYNVTVTADAAGPVQDTTTIVVIVGGGATTTTTTSTPTTTTLPALPLTVSKLVVSLKFAKTGRDVVVLKGSFTPPAGFTAADQALHVDVGGAIGDAVLNRKGRAKGIAVKSSGKVKIALKRGAFAAALADEGLTDETVSGRAVTIPVALEIGDARFAADRAATYSAKAGKKGKAK